MKIPAESAAQTARLRPGCARDPEHQPSKARLSRVVHPRGWQRAHQSRVRAGAGCGRSARGDRHRHARIARIGAEPSSCKSDTFVDSITAQDIGAFPDKSVAEALQRVPGITVSRLQSSDDSNHFSAEPATVLIRGLTFVRTQFNGRDSFSADGYRGLNFNDVSPELMAGVDSYKNQTAEMIEGGIAGVGEPAHAHALRFGRPDDRAHRPRELRHAVPRSRRTKPRVCTATPGRQTRGRFGLLVNAAYSNILTRTEAVNMTRITTFCSDYPQVGGAFPNAVVERRRRRRVQQQSLRRHRLALRAGPGELLAGGLRPHALRRGAHTAIRERRQEPAADADRHPLALRESVDRAQRQHQLAHGRGLRHAGVGAVRRARVAAHHRQLQRSAPNGMLESGVHRPAGGRRGLLRRHQRREHQSRLGRSGPAVRERRAKLAAAPCLTGSNVSNEARIFDHDEQTRDFSFNVKWDITENLHTSFDVQYIKARDQQLRHPRGRQQPRAGRLHHRQQWHAEGRAVAPRRTPTTPTGFLANPHNYWMQFIQDHWENNDADEIAARADVEYDLGSGGWLSSLKAGVRFADREQKVRYSSYNWAPIAPSWGCNGPGFNVDNTTPAPYPAACGNANPFNGYPAGIWESTESRRVTTTAACSEQRPAGVPEPRHAARLRPAHRRAGGSQRERAAGLEPALRSHRQRRGEGCFTAPEILDVREKSKAAYLMLRFGGPEANLGSVNVRGQRRRALRQDRSGEPRPGRLSRPRSGTTTRWRRARAPAMPANNGTNQATDIQCWLTPALQAFSTGTGTDNTLDKAYTNVLPSFNVRFGFTDKQFMRFGYSKGMSRPDFGLLRNSVAINAPPIDTSNSSPYLIRDAQGQGHRLQLRVLGRSRVTRVSSRRKPTTSTCRTRRTIDRAARSRSACSTRSWRMRSPTDAPCATSRTMAARRP